MYSSPGDRAFRWTAEGDLHGWIVLNPSPKDYDEFTVLIGWSRNGRYPELSAIPSFELPTPEHAEFAHEEYLTRLPFLWTRSDRWWVVQRPQVAATVDDLIRSIRPISADDARRAVERHVDDALEKIAAYGVPYLEALHLHLRRGRPSREARDGGPP